MIEDDLAAYTANLVSRIGQEAAEGLFAGQIGQARGVLDGAVRKGQRAPDFDLPNANSERVTLSSLLERGPLVLTFYRGGWCPYCNIALRALQSQFPEIKRLGASLAAISPEIPDQSLTTQEKLALEFEVLSDADNVVARRFGLVYRVSDEARKTLLSLGRDLVAHNGTDAWELPVTATYVVARDGMIVFDHVDADYRVRLDPAAIIEALRE